MTTKTVVDVWLDETARLPQWIVSREDGDASYTLASFPGDDAGYRDAIALAEAEDED